MNELPWDLLPAHKRYGFGSLQAGMKMEINESDFSEPLHKIRLHLNAHGQYYGKKFRTRIQDGTLHILRVK